MRAYSFLEFLELPLQQTEFHNSEEFVFTYTEPRITDTSNLEDAFISKIKIPIIQRDYAQGRDDKKELREEFIDDLFKALESEKELKLDFIYGSVKKEDDNIFLPLDGQQRLTTLFLLHWLIIKAEAPKNQKHYQDLMRKFSYETRDTARKFFKQLVDFDFVGEPRKAIEKSYWFKSNYLLDPTVYSSLNMITSIYNRYNQSNRKLLSVLDNIKFYVLPMNNFNLTDDLYIKLNARGKILSPFENMKADIIGWASEVDNYKDISGHKSDEFSSIEKLAFKFDNEWSNLFWNNVNQFDPQAENIIANSIDPFFFKFIHRLIINDFIINYSGSDILKNEVYRELLKKESDLLYSNLDFYLKNNLISEKFIEKLETLLDFLANENNKLLLSHTLSPGWNKDFKWTIFKESYTMEDRMLLDAVNGYILNSPFDFNEEHFEEWIRIVWNLIADPDIRSIEASKTAMSVIRNISEFSSGIYDRLISQEMNVYIRSLKGGIHKTQLEEEQVKAIKIRENDEWKKSILTCENHKLFSGNIDFLLKDIESPTQLLARYKIASYLFNEKGASEPIVNQRHTLMRCIISEIITWDFLAGFNFSANEINWKTYLRRNNLVKRVIGELVNLTTLSEVSTFIAKSIAKKSNIDSNDSLKLVHQNLYTSNNFHIWMQEDGVNKIKWLGYHHFVIRPSAWYSKIMIDCYRNEIITELITLFKINNLNDHRCTNSDFYLGEHIEIDKTIENMTISFHFDNNKELTIGLRKELNLLYQTTDESDDNWFIKYIFDYQSVKTKPDVATFMQNIRVAIMKHEGDFKKFIFQ